MNVGVENKAIQDVKSEESGMVSENDYDDEHDGDADDDDERCLLQDGRHHRSLRSGSLVQFPRHESSVEDNGICGQPQHPDNVQFKVYSRRWYILFLFCMINLIQACLVATWISLANSAKAAYDWTDADLAMMSNWMSSTYLISALPFTWLMDSKGLRLAVLVASGLLELSGGIRCIASIRVQDAIWLMQLSQVCAGLAGPVTMGATPLVSSVWFPVEQRTLSSGIISAAMNLGLGAALVVGPLVVSDYKADNGSSLSIDTDSLLSSSVTNSTTVVRDDLNRLMYIEFGIITLVFVAVALYFPDTPPTPPSVSAGTERLDYKTGFLSLMRNWRFWNLGVPFMLSVGVYAGFGGVMGILLTAKDISQKTIGFVGFVGLILGSVFCVLISRIADSMKHRIKLCLITLLSLATASMVVFAIAYQGIIPLSDGLTYATVVITSTCVAAGVPLYYEVCCESSYPIAEGITNGLLTMGSNILCLVPVLLFLIPNIGISWMVWCTTGSLFASAVILLPAKVKYGRLILDHPIGVTESSDDEPLLTP